MGNGIFLGTSVINGVPTLFQYTMQPNDPVVIVELYNPSKDDLVPSAPVIDRDRFKPGTYESPLRRHLKDTGVISEGSVDSLGHAYLNQAIAEQVQKLGQEQWAVVLAEHGEPLPENWDVIVKSNVTMFLESPDTARRLVERVSEDAVVKIIVPGKE
jgi:hypothetical protein